MVDVRPATEADLPSLAGLLWAHSSPDEQTRADVDDYADALGLWWREHAATHVPLLAWHDGTPVGVVWLALVPRVPRPGDSTRFSADLQSLYVLEERRGQGIGAALVKAASRHAAEAGAGVVVVQSGRRAVPLYQRLGFSSSAQLLRRSP